MAARGGPLGWAPCSPRGGGAAAVAQELPVDLELVLAVDVSGSIDAEEARQQRDGYVAAIADAAVVQAIQANFTGGSRSSTEWASADYQRVALDWAIIEDDASAKAARRQAGRGPGAHGAGPRSARPSTPPCRCSRATATPGTGA